ncbi:YihY/virulence factor BrkB family protein [Diaminobutyricibacter tongyongensis]|uniref:YihY/virulence factor BrkB family protein n=1 Tax=Leifsonia tongyongensis TaxID=1268043 RepID=A0A6L9XVP1_9MICO|nr:YihY/virulence factor BrkB family protein [Diaminobutyricibacter tongyongensis]
MRDRGSSRGTGAASGSEAGNAHPVPWNELPLAFILRRTLRSFGRHQCTDLAAGLTYFAVLSLFPALLALVSILGLVGQSQKGIDALFAIVAQLAPGAALDTVKRPIEQLASSPATGLALVIGIVGAIWSASGYVGAFGRAVNHIYGVQEGRTIWKLRPVQLGVTIATLLLVSLMAVLLVISGPIATAIGDALGLGDTVQVVWSVLKWPVLIVAVMVLTALLYYATPNVRLPRFRMLTFGSTAAIIVLGVASALFGLYVANFGNYNRTYGSLAGIIIFLLWMWIANVALLLGAELDVEVERARELTAGIEADEGVRLPLKSSAAIVKAQDAVAADLLASREVRRRFARARKS